MPLLARTVLAPLSLDIRPGALSDLGTILADRRISAGGQVAIVVGHGIGEQVSDLVRPRIDRAELITIAGGTLNAALELGAKLRSGRYDAVAGIGGGKIIDTVKYAASHQGLPMIAVPTSLAHDGIASPISVLERDGTTVSYGVHTPFAVVVDLDFVRRAPRRHTTSGVGDALSNLSAAADWQLAHEATGEPMDGLALALATTGAEALAAHQGTTEDDDFLAVLANALVLGGVAMAMAGDSRPCSGGCHEISHALDQLAPGVALHGEQVALGALFCTFLRGDKRLLAKLGGAFARHGLPRVPAELGLSDALFADAVALAPQTRPSRYTILEHLQLSRRMIPAKVDEFIGHVGRGEVT